MAIELARGPIARIDIDAVMGNAPEPDLEAFVAQRLGDLDGVDDRLQSNLAIMQTGLDSAIANDPGADIDEAVSVHTSLVSAPPPDFSGVATAAEVEADRLASLAGTLPADPNATHSFTVETGDDEFSGVTIDWDNLTRGGGSGGGGGGGTDVDTWKAKLDTWCRDHFGRPADQGELHDIDVLLERHGTITQALFDQLIRENYEPRL